MVQCWSNVSLHVPIYLQPFLRYSDISVASIGRKLRHFHTHFYLAAPQGVTPSEFREDLDKHKTRMNGQSCGEESMTICSAVLIQYQRVTDGRTDRQTIAKTCFSIADARKISKNAGTARDLYRLIRNKTDTIFIARQNTDARYWYSNPSVCPSVCSSVTRWFSMKTA